MFATLAPRLRDNGWASRRTVRNLRRRFGTVGDLAVVLDERGDLVLVDRFGGGISHCDGSLLRRFRALWSMRGYCAIWVIAYCFGC